MPNLIWFSERILILFVDEKKVFVKSVCTNILGTVNSYRVFLEMLQKELFSVRYCGGTLEAQGTFYDSQRV